MFNFEFWKHLPNVNMLSEVFSVRCTHWRVCSANLTVAVEPSTCYKLQTDYRKDLIFRRNIFLSFFRFMLIKNRKIDSLFDFFTRFDI